MEVSSTDSDAHGSNKTGDKRTWRSLFSGNPRYRLMFETCAHTSIAYVCLYLACSARFSRSSDLDRHIKTHFLQTVERIDCPYGADLCGRNGERGFSRKDHWTEHLTKVHGVQIRCDTESRGPRRSVLETAKPKGGLYSRYRAVRKCQTTHYCLETIRFIQLCKY